MMRKTINDSLLILLLVFLATRYAVPVQPGPDDGVYVLVIEDAEQRDTTIGAVLASAELRTILDARCTDWRFWDDQVEPRTQIYKDLLDQARNRVPCFIVSVNGNSKIYDIDKTTFNAQTILSKLPVHGPRTGSTDRVRV